jgi:GH24 family phage-related lysozyme (muramidase)
MVHDSDRQPVQACAVSVKGLALILRFEGYVPWPYDDMSAARRYVPITSSLGTPTVRAEYPEWTGGPLQGTLTIGYGHTSLTGKSPRVVAGLRLSEPEAFALLRRMLAEVYEPDLRRLVRVPLSQGEYDALVSFIYNLGAANLARSTLLRRLNAGDHDAVPDALMQWTRAKGVVLPGLLKRRQAEAALWRDAEPGARIETAPATRPDPPMPDEPTPDQTDPRRAALVFGATLLLAAIVMTVHRLGGF